MRRSPIVPFFLLIGGIVAVMAGVPLWIALVSVFAIAMAVVLLVIRPWRTTASVPVAAEMVPFEAGRRASIRRRALLAVLLTVGFYLLAFAVMGVLIGALLLDIGSGHIHFVLVFISVAGTWAILKGIMPSEQVINTPWPRITADEQPRLFEKLRAVAAKAGQPMPDEVLLLPELNAWVADIDRAKGEGRRRVMGIGLPLLQVLDVSQLCAVIAHEFGHYYGGDTQLGPWIYRTRGTIGRTLTYLSQSSIGGVRALVHIPFAAYGRMFMRVTQSVSRQQEYTADRFAAAIVSPGALGDALKRLDGYGPGVAFYWNRLLLPAVGTGYRPSITGGLQRLLASESFAKLAAEHTEQTMNEVTKDSELDTHPCLRNRMAALETLPSRHIEETAPAVSLLDDVAGAEKKLLRLYLPEEAIANLKGIEWSEVPETVFVRTWEQLRHRNRDVMAEWTVDRLPEMLEKAREIAALLVDAKGEPVRREAQLALLLAVLRAGLAMALIDAGWTFIADPERGVFFVREEQRIDLDTFIDDLVTGRARPTSDDWLPVCEKAGISGMSMGGGKVVPPGSE